MYTVTYFANRREVSAPAASWTRAMDKATAIALRQSTPPFPIVIKDDLGQIIHTIHG